MKKSVIKLIICICVIACLMVGFCTSYASAVAGEVGAGLVGAALEALAVKLGVSGGATLAILYPWLNNDYSISGIFTGIADGYIKITDNEVFIDGVSYTDVWIDPNFALGLHTQAFDFISQFGIASNSSGNFLTGAGYLDGLPVYSDGQYGFTQTFQIPFAVGQYQVGNSLVLGVTELSNPVNHRIDAYRNGASHVLVTGYPSTYYPVSFRYRITNPSVSGSVTTPFLKYANSQNWGNVTSSLPGSTPSYVAEAFDFTYVSQTIDPTPLASDVGFRFSVPSADLISAGFSRGTTISSGVDDAAIKLLLELIDQLAEGDAIKNPEFAEDVDPPVPPVPDTTIADTAYADLHDELLDIKNAQAHAGSALDNIDAGIDVLGRTVDHLDETVTDIEGYIQTGTTDIIDSVDTAGQAVVDGLSDVEGAIDTYGQSVVTGLSDVETAIDTAGQSVTDAIDSQTTTIDNAIDAVAEKVDALDTTVDEVIEKIETHPFDLFDAFLDKLTSIPVIKDLFDGIKHHVGIWHYVVEWLQCIGTFLTFFIGLFSDVAYCMVVPIYACVAGAICLAFYKRFGR